MMFSVRVSFMISDTSAALSEGLHCANTLPCKSLMTSLNFFQLFMAVESIGNLSHDRRVKAIFHLRRDRIKCRNYTAPIIRL